MNENMWRKRPMTKKQLLEKYEHLNLSSFEKSNIILLENIRNTNKTIQMLLEHQENDFRKLISKMKKQVEYENDIFKIQINSDKTAARITRKDIETTVELEIYKYG